MADEIRRRRGLNYLGELGAKLRDLRGTATLAHELIQNAEDAIKDIRDPSDEQATLVFRVDQERLIIDNGGVFSDCGFENEDDPVCPWKTAGGRPCDFHSFADVGGGAKRRASNNAAGNSGLKGAFGFGFTAVYQVTDHPEVISNNRHWILEDENSEEFRIRECSKSGCESCRHQSLPGTRFILPWAYDPKSEIRIGLSAPVVSKEKPAELVRELEEALPQTLLFLDHLREAKVFWQGCELMSVKISERSASVISVTRNGKHSKWVLLEHDFKDEAEKLRARHPAGEKTPSSLVKIAVPQGDSSNGLFFAYLPTQVPTEVPFHVNADFFPSNDRKRLLLETDYQGDWNRAAIKAGSIAFGNGLITLQSHMGPKSYWNMLQKVKNASTVGSLLDSAYWELIRPRLSKESVVPARDGSWHPASAVRLVSEDHARRFSTFHAQIGVLAIHPEIGTFCSLLTSPDVGVRSLDLHTIATGLVACGITGEQYSKEFPQFFQSLDNWKVVWQQLAELLQHTSPEALNSNRSGPHPLLQCSLVKCTDEVFRPLLSTVRSDAETRTLFMSIGAPVHFACDDADMHKALSTQIPEFSVSEAVTCIEGLNTDSLRNVAGAVKQLLQWFNCRVDKLRVDKEIIQRFKSLILCPTTNGLQSFNSVVLPGGFTDPIGITCIADTEALTTVGNLIAVLELKRLTLHQYVAERLPKTFEATSPSRKACFDLLGMLSMHQGELYSSPQWASIRDTLRTLKCVPCNNNTIHAMKDGLFVRTELLVGLLANSVTYIDSQISSGGVETFLKQMGVESQPRLDCVVDRLLNVVEQAKTVTAASLQDVTSLLMHLGERVEEIKSNTTLVTKMRTSSCLPSVRRKWNSELRKWQSTDAEWAVPTDIYHYKARDLCGSVVRFVHPTTQKQIAHLMFLEVLGVMESPRATTVLRHLQQSAQWGCPIKPLVYHFLNRELRDRRIYASDFSKVRSLECLYNAETDTAKRPKDCYLKEHPFGARRVLLSSQEWAALADLSSALGIRSTPTWSDAIEVIREIAASDDVSGPQEITNDDKHILRASWRIVDEALRGDETLTEQITRELSLLSAMPVVCRTDNRLDTPVRVFFRDQDYLAEAFAVTLSVEIIPMPRGAIDALSAAGVRRLSEVTQIRVIHNSTAQGEAVEVKKRIRERAALLVNVVETCRSSRGKTTALKFDAVEVIESLEIHVELTFCGFESPLPPVVHAEFAVFDEPENTLRYCLHDGSIPWDAIARELARLFLETDDVTKLSAAICSAIEPDSIGKAKWKLSQLGFPSIEVSEDAPKATNIIVPFSVGNVTSANDAGSPFGAAEVVACANDANASNHSENGLSYGGGTVVSNPPGELLAKSSSDARQTVLAGLNPNEVSSDSSSESTWIGPSNMSSTNGEAGQAGENLSKVALPHARFVELLAFQPGTTDRRQSKIRDLSKDEVRRSSAQVVRTQRINRISDEEVFQYLRSLYSFEEVLICQMRSECQDDLHPMPFRKKDCELYWGKRELFNRELTSQLPFQLPEDVRLFLFLCPTCASIYTEFIGTQQEEQQRLLSWITSDVGATVFRVNCSLSGQQPDRSIHFHPRHLDDIRSVDGII